MRILLVEDSPHIGERLTELIEERGEHVVLGCFDTAASAVERIAAEQPDVAIFDIRLREGNGIDALAAAKRLRPELMGIVMSSHMTLRHEQASREAGAVRVLDKSELDEIPSILSSLAQAGHARDTRSGAPARPASTRRGSGSQFTS
jgi:DNA-binding NtrC family response regulator